jgi:tetratricopeptide (TPR) repeat protein
MVGNADQLPPVADGPAWFDYGYAKSMLLRGDRAPVQKWLESLPKRTEAADLLLGEILLTGGSVDQGLARLNTIAEGGSPLASRARWTLALTELDRGNTAKARELTLADASFAESIQGQELLARAALALGDRKESIRIYEKLGEQSVDAMIFLSKEAFGAENFADSRRWTLTLARRFPEQAEFRKNLLKIDEVEAAKTKKP